MSMNKAEDVEALKNKIAVHKKAIESAFFNTFDDCYIGNVQGGNAFALNIGLGTKKTLDKLIACYEKQACFDTGIFGTELVSKTLFESGRADLAVKLLTATQPAGFGAMMKEGATTLWEEWASARSHSHPMFGAVTAHLFEYLLGIRQTADSIAYDEIVISPVFADSVNHLKGSITTVKGEIAAELVKTADSISYSIVIPDNVKASLILPDGTDIALSPGKNDYTYTL